jgi:hypothetical protein
VRFSEFPSPLALRTKRFLLAGIALQKLLAANYAEVSQSTPRKPLDKKIKRHYYPSSVNLLAA